MTTEAEKAYKVWLVEQQAAGCWFNPELLKPSFVHGYESTFCAGHASRDAEVAKLKAEIEKTRESHIDLFDQREARDEEIIVLKARIKELEEPFAKLKEIAANMQSMPPEFAKIVDEDFWELLA